LRQHAGTQEQSYLLRVNLVVLGFAAVNLFHVQGMTKNKGYLLPGAKVGKPVPAKDTLDADHNILPKWRYR
jgi:hypothetical protein